MNIHIPNGIFEFISALVLVLFLAHGAWAIPHVYIDDVAGNDANGGFSKNDAITSTNGTYTRAIQLGVLSDTIGIKIINADTPSADFCRSVNDKKADRVCIQNTRNYPNHGELPSEDIEESHDGGFRVRMIYSWQEYVAKNGVIGLRMVYTPPVVEAY